MKGKFIVLEGPEGSGKTTMSSYLSEKLRREGLKVLETREPGGSDIGERIRNILLDSDLKMNGRTELFLFLAARAEFVESIVKPHLEKGHWVISDRFDLSTMAYQVYSRGLPEKASRNANDLAKDFLTPDLCVLLMTSFDKGKERQEKMGKSKDRIEREGIEFHRKVFEGYKRFSKKENNVLEIDTDNLSLEEVKEEIWKHVSKVL